MQHNKVSLCEKVIFGENLPIDPHFFTGNRYAFAVNWTEGYMYSLWVWTDFYIFQAPLGKLDTHWRRDYSTAVVRFMVLQSWWCGLWTPHCRVFHKYNTEAGRSKKLSKVRFKEFKRVKYHYFNCCLPLWEYLTDWKQIFNWRLTDCKWFLCWSIRCFHVSGKTCQWQLASSRK